MLIMTTWGQIRLPVLFYQQVKDIQIFILQWDGDGVRNFCTKIHLNVIILLSKKHQSVNMRIVEIHILVVFRASRCLGDTLCREVYCPAPLPLLLFLFLLTFNSAHTCHVMQYVLISYVWHVLVWHIQWFADMYNVNTLFWRLGFIFS